MDENIVVTDLMDLYVWDGGKGSTDSVAQNRMHNTCGTNKEKMKSLDVLSSLPQLKSVYLERLIVGGK